MREFRRIIMHVFFRYSVIRLLKLHALDLPMCWVNGIKVAVDYYAKYMNEYYMK